eukprot:gene23233-35605_t
MAKTNQLEIDGTHILEGDGCLPNFFYYLWKKRNTSVFACHNLKIPSTVVFSDGFPKEWIAVTKQGDLERKVGKEIRSRDILRDMCHHGDRVVTEDGIIVAWYMFKLPKGDKDQPAVAFFDRSMLGSFLYGRVVRRDGFLQKFIMPDGKRNVVIQAIWSPNPAAQVVVKRESVSGFHDRRHTMQERATTFEGPVYHSREAFVAPHIQWQVKQLCQDFVNHFQQTEHAAVQRMVLHFKTDAHCEVWLLWCSSIRIHSHGKSDPLDVGTEYINTDVINDTEQSQPISLLDGLHLDFGTAEETNALIAAPELLEEYNPKPPSLGPLADTFSRFIGYKAVLQARRRCEREIGRKWGARSQHARRRKKLHPAAPPGPPAAGDRPKKARPFSRLESLAGEGRTPDPAPVDLGGAPRRRQSNASADPDPGAPPACEPWSEFDASHSRSVRNWSPGRPKSSSVGSSKSGKSSSAAAATKGASGGTPPPPPAAGDRLKKAPDAPEKPTQCAP